MHVTLADELSEATVACIAAEAAPDRFPIDRHPHDPGQQLLSIVDRAVNREPLLCSGSHRGVAGHPPANSWMFSSPNMSAIASTSAVSVRRLVVIVIGATGTAPAVWLVSGPVSR